MSPILNSIRRAPSSAVAFVAAAAAGSCSGSCSGWRGTKPSTGALSLRPDSDKWL